MLRRFTATFALAGAFACLCSGQALAGTVIGSAAGNTTCGGDAVMFQSGVHSGGPSYTVPAGTWTLSSWSTQAGGNSGQQMAVLVARPTGTANQYAVVSRSSVQTLTPNTLNTFTTALSVQAGDLLGFWATAAAQCGLHTGSGADQWSYWLGSTPPSPGTTLTVSVSSSYLLNISATLTAAVTAATSTSHAFVCYSRYEQDGGAVFDVAQALQLLAQGWWLPTALPGNVPGGTNLGDYHLDCNPPSTTATNGWFVGGGGDVVDRTYADDAGIGYYPAATTS